VWTTFLRSGPRSRAWPDGASFWSGRSPTETFTAQRARSSRAKSKVEGSTAIFVLPPSFAELERRLKARMLEPDDVIGRRLEIAKSEILFYRDYDYIIINDILDNSILLLESIVRSGTAVPRRQQGRIEEIIASFGGLA
jgi:guanylate kinase